MGNRFGNLAKNSPGSTSTPFTCINITVQKICKLTNSERNAASLSWKRENKKSIIHFDFTNLVVKDRGRHIVSCSWLGKSKRLFHVCIFVVWHEWMADDSEKVSGNEDLSIFTAQRYASHLTWFVSANTKVTPLHLSPCARMKKRHNRFSPLR